MEFLELADLSEAQVVRTREIYEDNFPAELRAPFETLADDRALAYVDDEGVICGFVVLREMVEGLFLRFFVAGVRGRGIGSLMWTDLCAAHPDATRIALDVEDPDEPGIDDAELLERNRRIEFYRRLGVDLLPVRGYRPPHDGEEPPLRLMLWSRAPGEVDVAEVVTSVYRDRYGLPATDPTVLETLNRSGR